MGLIIRQDDLKTVIKMAERSTVEVCGFLFGRREGGNFIVEEVRFVPNRLNSPTAFEMEPVEMVRAIDEAGERGLEVIGIFHSHLKCPPRPSGRDLKGMRLWPVVWLIVDEKGNYGAYVLEGNKIREVRIVEKE
ncbi:M67 family metallopeptidase [Thermococcus thioreducens]|uniref:Metalloprotease n=1 Tax=Thermococcus thioreducens TaxID=277988 RepID=A0A0Q2XK64_9EURY|nr:M67 family metallopeptidase [Thermococcus thioreducens]ASJ12969.1 metalloprotease [Thermococcus thioreducens]KQH81484.1 metalloprotease [Thermococcus thioreducens]SEV82780.1 Proteasome lid subunit RPN8/RPN11, contains Jab1/MPN metalloenzyme (JAMM) motif [Thermococcus thioreducens]